MIVRMISIIHGIDVLSVLTEKFLHDSTEKMVKDLESLDKKYNIEGVSAKNLIMDLLIGYKGMDFKIIIISVKRLVTIKTIRPMWETLIF